jgi:hypothetical protein
MVSPAAFRYYSVLLVMRAWGLPITSRIIFAGPRAGFRKTLLLQ